MNGEELRRISMSKLIQEEGFFAKSFPIDIIDEKKLKFDKLPDGIGELSDSFSFSFENSGVMKEGYFYTIKTSPLYEGKQITLGDIMEEGEVDKQFFIPEERLYYTYPEIDHSDETKGKLPKEHRQTWQYVKGAKKINRNIEGLVYSKIYRKKY